MKFDRRTGIASLILAAAIVIPAMAAEDLPVQRQAMMGSVGAATGAAAAMVKGEAPYDPRVAALSLRIMNAVANGFGAQFPEGSETGANTEAKDTIWSDRAGFEAELAKFREATAAGIAAKPADLDAFKPIFGMVTQSCGSCHKGYRVKKG